MGPYYVIDGVMTFELASYKWVIGGKKPLYTSGDITLFITGGDPPCSLLLLNLGGLLCYGLSLQCLSLLNMDVNRIGYTQKTIGGAGFFMVILQSPQGLFLSFLRL